MYRQVHAVSGATILGNGTVALILDPERLIHEAVRAGSEPNNKTDRSRRITADPLSEGSESNEMVQ